MVERKEGRKKTPWAWIAGAGISPVWWWLPTLVKRHGSQQGVCRTASMPAQGLDCCPSARGLDTILLLPLPPQPATPQAGAAARPEPARVWLALPAPRPLLGWVYSDLLFLFCVNRSVLTFWWFPAARRSVSAWLEPQGSPSLSRRLRQLHPPAVTCAHTVCSPSWRRGEARIFIPGAPPHLLLPRPAGGGALLRLPQLVSQGELKASRRAFLSCEALVPMVQW